LLETQPFKNLKQKTERHHFSKTLRTKTGGFYLFRKTMKFTRLFAIRNNQVKMSFLLLQLYQNYFKVSILPHKKLKIPIIIPKFSEGVDFNLTKWILLF